MKILVTGAAGFIGFHLCEKLIGQGHKVVGIDSLNDYYDVNLKLSRLRQLGILPEIGYGVPKYSESAAKPFTFIKINLEDKVGIPAIFQEHAFDLVCNLAAQGGVRYSIENPFAYVDSNLIGFMNILEACRNFEVKKLVYASSSSVYGMNDKVPFSTTDNVDHPVSLYAATKKSNELMAHTYSHLFGIQTVGLRFFTVYGPWGRPDMAMFLFTDAILNHKPIKIFNNGDLSRDFTYIDDIIQGISNVSEGLLNGTNTHSYKIYNIGNSKPVRLLDFISEIEYATGLTAEKVYLPMQSGDVEKTWADTEDLKKDYGYNPKIDICVGIKHFVNWYKEYYDV